VVEFWIGIVVVVVLLIGIVPGLLLYDRGIVRYSSSSMLGVGLLGGMVVVSSCFVLLYVFVCVFRSWWFGV